MIIYINMNKTSSLLSAALAILFGLTETCYAAHPLITDDAGTQGKRKAQLEFTGEYGHDSENGVTTDSLVFPLTPVLSYGITDSTDIVLGIPFERIKTRKTDGSKTDSGVSDMSVQGKWRFYDKHGLSFALKPGITLPTGNENKGLGNGKLSYSAFFIVTKEIAPWAFYFNIGYFRNEYKLRTDQDANRKNIWHISLASQRDIVKGLKAVANIGIERNPDKTSSSAPAFLLGGLIYSITEDIDIDAGVKYGLTRPETDISYLAGLTWRL